MKKLFTIACPVILATLGVALLFIIRKKRKEKRLKRLRGEGRRAQGHCPQDGAPDLYQHLYQRVTAEVSKSSLFSQPSPFFFFPSPQMPRAWQKC